MVDPWRPLEREIRRQQRMRRRRQRLRLHDLLSRVLRVTAKPRPERIR